MFKLEEMFSRFNYGINHGRVSMAGYKVGKFIQKTVNSVIPGHPGKIIGGLCAIPVVAPTELVSGIHNVLSKKDNWMYKTTIMSDGTRTKPWSEL